MTVILEVGPGVVRALAGGADPRADEAMQRAALEGVDEPVVLLDERPVGTADLWRTLIGSMPPAGTLTMVHPSWWPPARVERIAGAAGRPVLAVTRAEVIGGHLSTSAVVEITEDLIAVSAGRTLRLFGPDDIAAAAAAARLGGDTVVAVDVPRGVAGAAGIGARICAELRDAGVTATQADLAGIVAAGNRRPARPGRRRWSWAAGAAALAAAVAVAAPALRQHPAPQAPEWASLVEGNIAVRIPAQWAVQRVTSGPGSRRVEVSSPDGAVLHITQAHAPGTTLADAATVLRRAMADQQEGVFTEFHPEDRVGERPAVTYREVRPGRSVRWAVVLDGDTRISVGCQDPPGPAGPVEEVCASAVASARELARP